MLADRHKAQGLLDNLCKSEFNIIASYSNDVNTSIQYFLDVNLKGIRLDTEDIFKGYLFSQDSRELTRSLWQKNKRDVLRLNGVTQSSEEKRYPLMKLYEHFFYCDLYLTSDTMVENPIVKNYMHSSSDNINRAAGKDRLNIKASVIYPEPEQTFWSRVIGLGYPTPEPPGFRWCTDRLKIMPMNKFVNERIKESGEIIILLGVRKGESLTRMKTITAREIEGKLLNMHNDIPNAYVYNPITEIPNDLVWEFLLKGDCRSPWGSDMKYLFSLYQGENLGEEKSVLGEVDREKIPVTGNSRFGCWCCTMVKEDKSLQNFINKGATELIPLREFRNELLRMREDSQYRDSKRRNGSVYKKSDGSFGMGPFTLEARRLILEGLLDLENRTGMELITEAELKVIDKMWDEEGDLTCRALVESYHKVKGKKLPWDDYKTPRFDDEAIQAINDVANKYDIPVELITKLS